MRGKAGLFYFFTAPSASQDIVAGHDTTPFISAYPWSAGFGTKYSDPGTAMPGIGRGVAFSP